MRIHGLTAEGETALFDATYEAIAALDAERPPGKRAVVALTDGVDNSSRRRVDEVIARAKEAKIPLYMLGFGREGELDLKVMERMAQETGGRFYHAKNKDKLMEGFELLSNQLHDDGIDEEALKQLARETGGEYFHAKEVEKLKFAMGDVVEKMVRKEYVVTFPSLYQKDPGTEFKYDIKLVRLTGEVVGGSEGGPGYHVVVGAHETDVRHGLVVPSVNHLVYIFFLLLFGVLLILPAGLRRRPKADN